MSLKSKSKRATSESFKELLFRAAVVFQEISILRPSEKELSRQELRLLERRKYLRSVLCQGPAGQYRVFTPTERLRVLINSLNSKKNNDILRAGENEEIG